MISKTDFFTQFKNSLQDESYLSYTAVPFIKSVENEAGFIGFFKGFYYYHLETEDDKYLFASRTILCIPEIESNFDELLMDALQRENEIIRRSAITAMSVKDDNYTITLLEVHLHHEDNKELKEYTEQVINLIKQRSQKLKPKEVAENKSEEIVQQEPVNDLIVVEDI